MLTRHFHCVVFLSTRIAVALKSNLARQDVDRQAQCDLSKGKWQRAETPSLYDPMRVDALFRCPHKTAEKYSWIPDECELPDFQADRMQSIAAKWPIVMIGDSMVRNMYASLCMSLKHHRDIRFIQQNFFGCHRKFIGKMKPLDSDEEAMIPGINQTNNFKFEDSMLRKAVETSSAAAGPNLVSESSERATLVVDLSKTDLMFLKVVTNASIVMLGGGHHFAHRGNMYYWQGRVLSDAGGDINIEAYRLALTNVLRKLEDMSFTGHVILKTYSPAHFFYGDWDSAPAGHCNGRTEPTNDIKDYSDLGSTSFSSIEQTNSMLRSLTSSTLKINILDITGMSWGRADAHPGKETKNDCAHWCLPGVPDVWNQAFLRMLSALDA
mmetsp:Transcript_29367/g.66585  ORF Transcript_29367/g.66585 Transcript_29367/m.66585 type:complete len:381 (-) Transcript_29367:85-1227(-)